MSVPARQDGISYKSVPIAAHGGGGMLMPQTFGEVVAFSEIMARSQHAIPKHLRDVPGACLAVAMQAMRWSMDPFAVASKSYNVKDIIAYEAQLIAAVVHTRAPLKTRPDYTYSGEGQDRRCTVSAAFEDGVTRSYESPKLSDITIKNSPLWKADPDQQLGYYSIRAFARRYCPEVILGVYTPEEAETFRGPDNARDVTPKPTLADRLSTTGTVAGAAQQAGFSQSHVISEIGGDTIHDSNSAQPAHLPEPDTPATETSAPTPAVAGNLSESPEVAPTGEDGGDGSIRDDAPPPPSVLSPDWRDTYLLAMSRVTERPRSLPNRHNEVLQLIGGKANADEQEWMKAVYRLTERRLRGEITKDECNEAIREIS